MTVALLAVTGAGLSACAVRVDPIGYHHHGWADRDDHRDRDRGRW
jgi:hypothetical protein